MKMTTENKTQDENWLPVNWNPVYEVSCHGNIRRVTKSGYRYLKPSLTNHGYLTIHLSKNKEIKPYAVHRLVVLTHKGFDEKLTIDHLNGIKTDNRLANLEAVTIQENIKRASESGLTPRGDDHHQSKLDDCKILTAATLLMSGKNSKATARHFGISRENLGLAIRGKSYQHLGMQDLVSNMPRKCRICSIEFVSAVISTRYCSQFCRNKKRFMKSNRNGV